METGDFVCDCCGLVKAIDAYIEKADKSLSDQLKAEGYLRPEETLAYIEHIENDVAEALLAETDYFVTAAERAVDLEAFARDIWPRVKITDGMKAKLTTVFTEQFAKFMPDFIRYYLTKTDKALKLNRVSKRTTAWVESWSRELADIMQLNSHQEIEKILVSGLREGNSIAEFTCAILDSGIRDEYYKARRVAVTEVLTAHRAAQQEAYMQSPAVSEKAWKHTGAHKNVPRQNHVDMNGQRVPVDQPFVLIGADGLTYTPMFPGDPDLPPEERINCHCIEQPIVSEEILGLPLEERQRLQAQAVAEMDDKWERALDARNRAKAGIDV